MKKIIVFLLCIATVFGSLTACNKNDETPEAEVQTAMIGDEPVTVDDTNEYLVNGGKTEYKIVVGTDRTERYAAEELQKYIEESTAVKIPVVSDENITHDNNGRYISVGKTSLLKAQSDIAVDYSDLGDNGVTVNTKGNCVYISGATVNGTLFAVYRFLHYQIGFEAYAYDCVEINYYKSLKLKDFDYRHVPSLGLTTAEDAELSGPEKVKEAARMYVYASKNGGYDLTGNLFNGLWCHTTDVLITADYDKANVAAAEDDERTAKFNGCGSEDKNDEDFMAGFNKGIKTLFASSRGVQDDIGKEDAQKLYNYTIDKKKNLVPQYVKVKAGVKKDKDGNYIKDENGNYVYELDKDGNPKYEKDKSGNYIYELDKNGNYLYVTDENGNPKYVTDEAGNKLTDEEGYANYVRGYNAAYEYGNYHVGAEWQEEVKKIKIWYGNQACYSEKDEKYTKYNALDLASDTLFNKYVKTATGPYLMVGIKDGEGSCDCENCRAAEKKYGNAAGVQLNFMNRLATELERRMQESGIKKEITLVAFAYYSYREPPVKLDQNGNYVPFCDEVKPKSNGMVKVGILYTPIEACFTHPITDDGETCEKNATIAEEMKAWTSLTDNLMMYSYGTNFQAFKYHFNNWSHTGDSFRFYEKIGLKYYFEQACTQNGISPMSSMRTYVRSKLAWNSSYKTQDLINEFIDHYYGDGAEGVKQYFSAVMENFERIYTLAETEDQDIYYSRITSANFWTRPLMIQLESYLEKADYAVDLGSSDKKDVYKERIFREYFLIKDNEYTMYSAYLNSEELTALEELVMYGREKYNAYNSTETTNG